MSNHYVIFLIYCKFTPSSFGQPCQKKQILKKNLITWNIVAAESIKADAWLYCAYSQRCTPLAASCLPLCKH